MDKISLLLIIPIFTLLLHVIQGLILHSRAQGLSKASQYCMAWVPCQTGTDCRNRWWRSAAMDKKTFRTSRIPIFYAAFT
jgi:hypothetical protein